MSRPPGRQPPEPVTRCPSRTRDRGLLWQCMLAADHHDVHRAPGGPAVALTWGRGRPHLRGR